jgi:RNA polymerase sigma-70 factor (ECF subfamily)
MGASRFDTSPTSQSLLFRLRDSGDHQAWAQFHERYAPMIEGWCRHWFPRETDDMVQEVFKLLTERLKSFEYQPEKGRFRGYLKTVTNNLMCDLNRRAQRRPAIVGESVLYELEAGEDLEARLARLYDLERLELAKERVRARVEEQTWRIYVETAERFRRPAEVAGELGMRVGAVHQAKHWVKRLLQEEVAGLADRS